MNQNYAHVFSSFFRGVLAEDGAAWGKRRKLSYLNLVCQDMAKSKFLFAYINNLPSNICLKEKSKKKLLKISNHYC